jgi:hypothetical protein
MKENIENLSCCLETRMAQYGGEAGEVRTRSHRVRAPSAPELQPEDSPNLARSR